MRQVWLKNASTDFVLWLPHLPPSSPSPAPEVITVREVAFWLSSCLAVGTNINDYRSYY